MGKMPGIWNLNAISSINIISLFVLSIISTLYYTKRLLIRLQTLLSLKWTNLSTVARVFRMPMRKLFLVV